MKWQYRTATFDIPRGFFPIVAGGRIEDEELTRTLNQLGADGWELVSAFATSYEGGSTNMVVCVLKRPLGA